MKGNARNRWLGSLPPDWRAGRLFEVADAWTSNVDKHSVEGQPSVRLCNYTDVYHNDTITDDVPFMQATATPEQIVRFRIRMGDTILTKDSETADDIGIPAFVEYEADDLICGYHLAIVRPHRGGMDPKFLFWALKSDPTMGQWRVTAQGVTRVGIRSTDLSKVVVPIPPRGNQRKIAEYLDRETVQIDTLIAAQKRFIGLLQERRGAVVDLILEEASTQTQMPLRYVARDITVGIVIQPSQWYVDEGIPALRGVNVRPGRIVLDNLVCISQEGHATHRKSQLSAGDVVVVRTGQSGSAVVIPESLDGANAIDLLIIKPGDRLLGSYLEMVLNAPATRERSSVEVVGSIQGHLNVSALRALTIPVPPVDIQQEMVNRWHEQAQKIDNLIAKTQRHIELAKERRSALITEAVTGQIDIKEA